MESTEGHVATVHLKGPKSGIEVCLQLLRMTIVYVKRSCITHLMAPGEAEWNPINCFNFVTWVSVHFSLRWQVCKSKKKKITRAWSYISSQTNSEENKSASAVMIFLVSQVLAVKHFGCRALTSSFHWFAIFLSSSTESTLIFWATLHRGT